MQAGFGRILVGCCSNHRFARRIGGDSGTSATITIPAVTNATQSVHMVDRDEFTATVKFIADENYHVTENAEKSWKVTGNVVFGQTEGFALPKVEPVHGMVLNPWKCGGDVVAYTNLNGILTISGTGERADFASAADVPWDPTAIRAVNIGEEVTSVGKDITAPAAEWERPRKLSLRFPSPRSRASLFCSRLTR